jgi:hypothetical protein
MLKTWDLCLWGGGVSIVIGVAFIYWPAAFVVAGIGLMALGWMGAADGANTDDSEVD